MIQTLLIALVACLPAFQIGPQAQQQTGQQGAEDGLRGTVTITLGMEAYARGTEVTLGEIAQVASADPVVVTEVRALELGYAPAPGYSRVFRADQIKLQVTRKFPRLQQRFVGQRAVRVHPEVNEIQGETILAAARQQLQLEFIGQEITFSAAHPVASVAVPAGSTKHQIRARLQQIPDSSRIISIPVEILVDDVRYRTVWTSWEVAVWETRPVLASSVRAGQRLEANMFERRRIKRQSGAAKNLSEGLLAGAVALRDLKPGETVTALDVQRPVVIVLGEALFLRVRKGSIEARVSAVALESGAIGDRIRVRTSGSAQELVATIEARDTCTIDLGK